MIVCVSLAIALGVVVGDINKKNSNSEGGIQWNATSQRVQYNVGYGLYIDRNDRLYICDFPNDHIQRFSPPSYTSPGTTVAGNGTFASTPGTLNAPSCVYVDNSSNMYIADANNYRIQLWLAGASSGTTIAGTGVYGSTASSFGDIYGMFVDTTNRQIYVADYRNNRMMIWPFFGNASTFIITGINQIMDVQVDAAGYVYTASNTAGVGSVLRYPPNSTTGGIVVASGFTFTEGIRLDFYGNLYVLNSGNGSIQMFCASSMPSSHGVVVASGLSYPVDITFDSNMNLFVLDLTAGWVVKFAKL
ncbi:unnamed protein product [Didymodactylos carnosus]|uniref:NHL repeat-containing protein n=1 Tax=Didymodactylos carnosus TaxID=1234261 RepID=A0A814CEA6_9BILA|nr:unnamed protein product [Didymodactylos carnosus]CAF3716325.1 unnamed protein product [Didymodactylos carnosus]